MNENELPPRRVAGWLVLLVLVVIIGGVAWVILMGPRR
jgi:hypothetical protein